MCISYELQFQNAKSMAEHHLSFGLHITYRPFVLIKSLTLYRCLSKFILSCAFTSNFSHKDHTQWSEAKSVFTPLAARLGRDTIVSHLNIYDVMTFRTSRPEWSALSTLDLRLSLSKMAGLGMALSSIPFQGEGTWTASFREKTYIIVSKSHA